MESSEVGIREAIERVRALLELVGAEDITVHWSTEFGTVDLAVSEDGYDIFVNQERVPMAEDA